MNRSQKRAILLAWLQSAPQDPIFEEIPRHKRGPYLCIFGSNYETLVASGERCPAPAVAWAIWATLPDQDPVTAQKKARFQRYFPGQPWIFCEIHDPRKAR